MDLVDQTGDGNGSRFYLSHLGLLFYPRVFYFTLFSSTFVTSFVQ